MPFTDDDLKRLKEEAEIHKRIVITTQSGKGLRLEALLARLEAAEECVKLMLQDIPLPLEEKALKAWRKACGE